MKVPGWMPQTDMSSARRTRAFSQDEAMYWVGGFQVGSDTHWRYDQGSSERLVEAVRERDGVMTRA